MKTIIISGGNVDSDFALAFIKKEKPDWILGVDRGLEFCKKAGITPDYIMGDFDSVEKAALNFYLEKKIPVERFKPEKDETDTEIAVNKALELNSSSIWILGATGTRLDHVLGNFQVLAYVLEKNVPCYVVDAYNRIRLLTPGVYHFTKKEQFGKYVSLLPFTDVVNNLTLEGFKYPLNQFRMEKQTAKGLGVSNEITMEDAGISFDEGILMMIESRD